jgi:hypothetical protein
MLYFSVLGVKLYIDFPKFKNTTDFIESIIKEIENSTVDQLQKNDSLPTRIASAGLGKFSKSVLTWNNQLINQWLIETKLNDFVIVFDGANGETLFTLWEMKQKDYSAFLLTINQLVLEAKATNIKTITKLNFIKALDNIFKI